MSKPIPKVMDTIDQVIPSTVCLTDIRVRSPQILGIKSVWPVHGDQVINVHVHHVIEGSRVKANGFVRIEGFGGIDYRLA